jgi:hypothetical protein
LRRKDFSAAPNTIHSHPQYENGILICSYAVADKNNSRAIDLGLNDVIDDAPSRRPSRCVAPTSVPEATPGHWPETGPIIRHCIRSGRRTSASRPEEACCSDRNLAFPLRAPRWGPSHSSSASLVNGLLPPLPRPTYTTSYPPSTRVRRGHEEDTPSTQTQRPRLRQGDHRTKEHGGRVILRQPFDREV